MVTKISNKINLLASTTKLLVVGKAPTQIEETLNKYFEHKENLDITESSSEVLNYNLYEQFDLVIVSLNKESFEIYNSFHKDIPEKSIFIIDEDVYKDFLPYINIVCTTVINPVEENMFLNKLYGVLSVIETDNLIKTKAKVLNKYKNDTVNDDIDTFLDQYSGSIMFINDDLNESLDRLRDLELSRELFKDISTSLIQLTNILKQNESLRHLSSLLVNFADFLVTVDLESIDPSNFVAFDYLTTIVGDLTLYIDELFVYKLFKDVHIFEDSVENNMEYFKTQLLNGNNEDEEDEENLEFF